MAPDDADPMRYRDYANNADHLLRSMELNFLAAAADEQQAGLVPPKAFGGEGAASSGDERIERVVVPLSVSEPYLNELVYAMVRFLDHGCESGADRMLGLAELVIRGLVRAGVDVGWYDSPFPERND